MGVDTYVYPDTEVLKNKFNIRNEQELKEVERNLSLLKYKKIIDGKIKIKKSYDYEHLKSIHKELFKEIYTWAGKERTVDIAKTMLFCRTIFIQEEAQRIFNKLKKENYLKNITDKKEYSERLAKLFLDVNMLHPFREGNGRTQRIFIKQLAEENNYNLDWNNIKKEVVDRMSINDDYKEVAEIFEKNLKEIRQNKELNPIQEKLMEKRNRENQEKQGLKR